MHTEEEPELLSQYLNVESCYHLALLPKTVGSKTERTFIDKTKFVQDTLLLYGRMIKRAREGERENFEG